MMLRSLKVANFTAFGEAELTFSRELNVFIGENGTGKTHLLKLPYAVMRVGAEESTKGAHAPTKTFAQRRIAEKLVDVMRPEALGRLAKRRRGRQRCTIEIGLLSRGGRRAAPVAFHFATQSKSEVAIDRLPSKWWKAKPVFLPTRELLSIYPGFLAFYDAYHTEFDETWRDTCQLLGSLTVKGLQDDAAALLLQLEEAITGRLELDRRSDRFYLHMHEGGKMEMHSIAEGYRRVGMLAQLIATGRLGRGTCLFWDEPEANLNPRLIRQVAQAIFSLCRFGTQVFLATHSLFLLREIELLDRETSDCDVRYFAFGKGQDGVVVEQGELAEVGPRTLLDEDMLQSDRFQESQDLP